jgi:hypothetical protein
MCLILNDSYHLVDTTQVGNVTQNSALLNSGRQYHKFIMTIWCIFLASMVNLMQCLENYSMYTEPTSTV